MVRIFDPVLYRDMMEALIKGQLVGFMLDNQGRLAQSPASLWMTVSETVAWIVIMTWFVAGWGAYRALNNASRLRSAVAVVFLLFAVPSLGLLGVLAYAFS